MTDIGWLRIECAVEMKVGWFGWFHFIDWLIDEIDWWIEREQTTNFESNNDWLIDWQKRHIEDGWVGKEKFDWFNEINEWMNIIDLILFVCQIELIEMNEKALNALWLSSC